jgi:hypothetical protein
MPSDPYSVFQQESAQENHSESTSARDTAQHGIFRPNNVRGLHHSLALTLGDSRVDGDGHAVQFERVDHDTAFEKNGHLILELDGAHGALSALDAPIKHCEQSSLTLADLPSGMFP